MVSSSWTGGGTDNISNHSQKTCSTITITTTTPWEAKQQHNSHMTPPPRTPQRMSPRRMKLQQREREVDERRSKAKVGDLRMDITGGPPKRAGRFVARERNVTPRLQRQKTNDTRSKRHYHIPCTLSPVRKSLSAPSSRGKKERKSDTDPIDARNGNE